MIWRTDPVKTVRGLPGFSEPFTITEPTRLKLVEAQVPKFVQIEPETK